VEERGTVIDCADGAARVRIDRSGACEGCTVCEISKTGAYMIARAVDRLGVSPGDRVRIETKGVTSGKAAMLLFLVPLAFLFGGYGAGALACSLLGFPGAAQPVGAGCAVAFFLASFGVLSFVARRKRGGPGAGAPESVIVERL
jgi:sigma-E factor negative regulatory protein RseC